MPMKFWSLDEIPPETILILVKFWSSVSGLASRLLVSGFPISCWWHLTNDYFSERLKLASSCSLLQEGAHGWVRYGLGYGLADGYIYTHTCVCALRAFTSSYKYHHLGCLPTRISMSTVPTVAFQACPLSPFSISGFANPGGPAQMKGVFTGWFIDVIHLIKQLGRWLSCCQRKWEGKKNGMAK